jgi:hypothetical protein
MAHREYSIALIGDRAAGKTAFIQFLKGFTPLLPKNNKYHATISTEVHPIDHRRRTLNIYEMGKFSTFDTMPRINAAILITKDPAAVAPVLPGNPPVIIVNNKDYLMNRAATTNALNRVIQTLNQ